MDEPTQSTEVSALDRVNVKRLSQYIGSSIKDLLDAEPPTREAMKHMVTTYLDSLLNKRLGFSQFKVVCDSTNNTEVSIDQGVLHVDIVGPATPEWIAVLKDLGYVIVQEDGKWVAKKPFELETAHG